MPGGYDQKRRIGSILREAGAIVAFRQYGDFFYRPAVVDLNLTTVGRALAVLNLSVPTGIFVVPIMIGYIIQNAAGQIFMTITDASNTNIQYVPIHTLLVGELNRGQFTGAVSNTSGQLVVAVTISAGTMSGAQLQTIGWFDHRGREA
jgi:hypothetical protein